MILCVDNNFESWKKSCATKLKEEVFGVAMPASVFMEIYGQDICTTPEDKSHMRREANGRAMQFLAEHFHKGDPFQFPTE